MQSYIILQQEQIIQHEDVPDGETSEDIKLFKISTKILEIVIIQSIFKTWKILIV